MSQTYSPRKYVYNLAANYNYKAFYEKEINLRMITKFPQFSTIIRLLFSGDNIELVQENTRLCFVDIRKIQETYREDFYYLDAMKSPINRIKSKHRFQILMRIKNKNLEKITQLLYNTVDKNRNAKVSSFVEINPQNLT